MKDDISPIQFFSSPFFGYTTLFTVLGWLWAGLIFYMSGGDVFSFFGIGFLQVTGLISLWRYAVAGAVSAVFIFVIFLFGNIDDEKDFKWQVSILFFLVKWILLVAFGLLSHINAGEFMISTFVLQFLKYLFGGFVVAFSSAVIHGFILTLSIKVSCFSVEQKE